MKKHAVVLFAIVAMFGAACSTDVVDQATSPIESAVEPEATLPEATEREPRD